MRLQVHQHDGRLIGVLAVIASLGSCSLLVDRSDQCRVDGDCAQFEGHPICRSGICVNSGLGPAGCYFGDPKDQTHYANACSTAQCIPFSNEKQAGLTKGSPFPAELIPPQKLGDVPPLVNNQPVPAIPCAHPSRPNLIYATGSTNLNPLLQAVAPLLMQNDPPFKVIYQPQSSCKGAGSMFEPDPVKRVIKDIPNNWAFFYDETGVKNYCLLHPDGNPVDIGESDVYAKTCGYDPKPGVGDYMGPIQAITFVVPSSSKEHSISAEAAHILFGQGGKMGQVPPWDDPLLYFVRGSGTGTIQLASRAIEVPAMAWWGVDRLSSDNLRDSMVTVDPTKAEKAIGVLSSDFADKARGSLRVLAFQGRGQACGYLPDSTPTSLDKANVRDGHYPIWGPIHLYAALNTVNTPSIQADALIKLLTVPRLDQQLLDAVIKSGYIPGCAMKVSRDQEMGPMGSERPPYGCGCYFEQQANGGRTTCQACKANADCPDSRPNCNYGFCEAQ